MKIFKREKGQSIVEFAFILPILLLFLGATVDLGRAVYAKTQLQNISGDLLHMVILENEYSYQGGSFKSIEDKIINEDFGMPSDYLSPEEKEGYAIRKIFKEFIEAEGLDTNLIDINNPYKYISLGPVKKGFNHEGKYPKLKKQVNPGEFVDTSELEYKPVEVSPNVVIDLDQYGRDRLGYNRNGVDINGISAEHPYVETHKHDRWKFDNELALVDNATYYREVTVTLPYEIENITFTGKMLFGEKRKLEQTISGIIYMGGDGRDITDPIFTGEEARNE